MDGVALVVKKQENTVLQCLMYNLLSIGIEQVDKCREDRFMQKASLNHLPSIFASLLLLAVAGCTTTPKTDAGAQATMPDGTPRISETELRAYCPNVVLREGTAFFGSYEKGGDKDASRLIFQATLSDTTRACQYGSGTTILDVAAAGRVVPGPKFRAGTYTLPIRVAVVQGGAVLYSKLHKQAITLNASNTATQFVFNDKGISIPNPEKRDVQIFVGFDEGPYTTK